MAAMQNLLGKHEGTDRAALMEYMKNGGVNLDPATTAWCAAIVNASLGQAGLPTTGSNMARSFLNYGSPVTEPQQGDIAVFQRGGPNAATGHVGFYQGRDANGNILVLGGNQGNQVSVAPFRQDSLLGYRRIAPPASFTKAALEPFQGSDNAAWATTKKSDTIDFNQQGQPAVPQQRRGALADRLPNAPPVAGDIQPNPPPQYQRTGPLADRLPNAPPVAPPVVSAPPGMAVGPWHQQVMSASAPGPNENVAMALRDQAIRTGNMPWAPQAGSGEASPGMSFGSLFGAAPTAPVPPGGGAAPSSATPQQQGSPFVDWLTQRASDIWNNTNRSASAPGRWF